MFGHGIKSPTTGDIVRTRSSREKSRERTRNFLLVVLAVAVVVIFFNLDIIPKGESFFTRSAERKLEFTGDLARKQFSPKEIEELLAFIRRNGKLIDNLTIQTSLQDSYRAVGDTTQVLFEMRLALSDGGTISTPTRRSQRKRLVPAILDKLDKDVSAYRKLRQRGGEGQSLVNTM
jgi:hypothetical protein